MKKKRTLKLPVKHKWPLRDAVGEKKALEAWVLGQIPKEGNEWCIAKAREWVNAQKFDWSKR